MIRWIHTPLMVALALLRPAIPQESTVSNNTPQQQLPASAAAPEEPPAPGPELLKYTPEQIEAAYEGKEMPEAVSMYLVIAKGGQLDGSGGWFGPAESRFSWPWLIPCFVRRCAG